MRVTEIRVRLQRSDFSRTWCSFGNISWRRHLAFPSKVFCDYLRRFYTFYRYVNLPRGTLHPHSFRCRGECPVVAACWMVTGSAALGQVSKCMAVSGLDGLTQSLDSEAADRRYAHTRHIGTRIKRSLSNHFWENEWSLVHRYQKRA